ncbi:AAA family ATPase [Blastomonas marina]|uniref:ATP-dependent nuclease n=1 Tax=Blastomonas marina TaxID=1867408 RepID=UPI002AC9200C|nr:AAA family ATPase [Blastomonas marina]WPZ03951.1 AAA family ATPase [Blastomonas marina]
MHIESVTLTNFRCFGPDPTEVRLGPEITALIGSNGAGKSAFIEALRRLFGATRAERTLTRSDIYFSPEETPDEVGTRQVVIDVVFALPELDEADEAEAIRTVPEVFQVMTSSGPGEPLRVRMRLEAEWTHGESYTDDIETRIYWVSHLDEVEFGEEGGAHLDKQRVQPSDRSKIQLFYVPATRDSGAVTRQALRQILNRLERSGDFGDDTEADIQAISHDLQEKVDELDAVKWITDNLKTNWARLHEGVHMQKPRLTVLSQEFTQIIRSLTAKVGPAPEGRERGIEELSEGQTSLFFLALSATLAQLEAEIANGAAPDGFSDLDISPPALTIYAVEEPENHLAPFYISRLMAVLADLCQGVQAMGIVTSHSPAILRRVPPESIRHFRLDSDACVSRVNAIAFDAEEDTEKFIRQAVHSQPEIYFAKLVILGEGDSEDIVIPRVAKALGVDLDPSFVSFAPLGGRHVNHFWRLLNCLEIPFLTLLDFDLGRHGAGPLRLKYAYDQLSELEDIEVPDWVNGDPDTANYWRTRKQVGIRRWREWMADRGIHYSYPLDLDMLMVRAFPDAYEVNGMGDPDDLDKLAASVFGKGDGMEAYEEKAPEVDHPTDLELAEYDYWFKKRSKPASHIQALAKLTEEEIVANCPEPLRLLIEQANEILNGPQPDDLEGLL